MRNGPLNIAWGRRRPAHASVTVLNRAHAFAKGLLGYWTFNDGNRLYARDFCGKYPLTKGGTGTGPIWLTSSEGIVARSSRGSTTGYLQHATFTNPTNITVLTRFRSSNLGVSPSWLNKSLAASFWWAATTGWGIGHSNAQPGDVFCRVNSTNCLWAGSTNIVADRWYTIGFTFDGATIRLYEGGIQRATAALAASITSNSDPLTTGYDDISGTYSTDLAFAAIWDRALSAVEMKSMSDRPYQVLVPILRRRGKIMGGGATSILRQMMIHHGG